MTYYDRITELTKNVPATLVDFSVPRDVARIPSQASSEFVTNREQGDWAEIVITEAINNCAKNHVAVKYGKSDDIVAGEEGFREFFEEFQAEMDAIGKRPDVLIFRKDDFEESLGYDLSHIPHAELSAYVKKAVAGIEVRSSAFLVDRYLEAVQQRTEKFTGLAMGLIARILGEFRDLLEHPNRSKYIVLLEPLTPETLTIADFKVPGWRTTDRLVDLNSCFKQLKVCIKEIQKRELLGITPKAEDIKVVYKWIETYNVPHFYFQVFFDKVYGLSFEQILAILTNPDNEDTVFSVGGDVKNQNKVTFKIKTNYAIPLAERVEEPEHASVRREIAKGRLLFYVTFKGGTAFLDVDRLGEILGIDGKDF